MYINLDELKREKEQMAEEYKIIEKYEALKEEEYKCKIKEYEEKLKNYYDEESMASLLYFKGLKEHHSILRIEANQKAESYSLQARTITEDDIWEF